MGLCQVVRTLLVDYMGLPMGNVDIAGIIYYIINIPIFVIGYRKMGKKFLFKTLVCVTVMSVGMSVIPVTRIVTDTMLSCVIGVFSAAQAWDYCCAWVLPAAVWILWE